MISDVHLTVWPRRHYRELKFRLDRADEIQEKANEDGGGIWGQTASSSTTRTTETIQEGSSRPETPGGSRRHCLPMRLRDPGPLRALHRH